MSVDAVYIVNQFGHIHTYPTDRPLPNKTRLATAQEIQAYERQDETNKKVIAAAKQKAKIANARFVVQGGQAPDDGLTDEERANVKPFRVDPANPNRPYDDPKPLHSPRPSVYPPTGEPLNPLTGLPRRYDGHKGTTPPIDERTENIPYDPGTGDFLRVAPATPLDPNIEPPQGQPGGRPIGADVDAEITPGEPLEVVGTPAAQSQARHVQTVEGSDAVVPVDDDAERDVNWNSKPGKAIADKDKDRPPGKAEGPKPQDKGKR